MRPGGGDRLRSTGAAVVNVSDDHAEVSQPIVAVGKSTKVAVAAGVLLSANTASCCSFTAKCQEKLQIHSNPKETCP